MLFKKNNQYDTGYKSEQSVQNVFNDPYHTRNLYVVEPHPLEMFKKPNYIGNRHI